MHIEIKKGITTSEDQHQHTLNSFVFQINDRIIQINETSIDREKHEDVLGRLRACEKEVTLLVIDVKSEKHYRNIVEFKKTVNLR